MVYGVDVLLSGSESDGRSTARALRRLSNERGAPKRMKDQLGLEMTRLAYHKSTTVVPCLIGADMAPRLVILA